MLINNKTEIHFFTKFLLNAFALNFIWENLHSSLYLSNTIKINNHFILMLYASFIDTFFILIIFLFIGWLNKNINWQLNFKNLFLFFIFLTFASLTIEIHALLNNRWVYGQAMPLIFGIGLSPLLQLAITGIISVKIAKIKK